ncbi:PLC-like phosphodiesterase [Coemansia spiralis]|nr:PLC-like phosphodiesterase [Coemansia spiralis]
MKLYRIFPNILAFAIIQSRVALASPEQPGSPPAQLCNGHAELCSRAYTNVSFACTHNAYSYAPPNDPLVLNQQRTIQQQLDDGIRAFMLDVVRTKQKDTSIDSVHLCHESCLLIDKGPLIDTLKVVKTFMDQNPTEIITFIIENVSGFTPEELRPSFEQAGLDEYAYTPEFAPRSSHSGYPWPTLGDMIKNNQRLVVFIDDKADTSVVPYILPEWEHVVEIPYDNVNPVESFPCSQDRPRDGIPRDLLVLNHFVYNRATIVGKNIDSPISPSQVKKHGYNTFASLSTHLDTCKQTWSQRVFNFITLDYYDIGDGGIFQAVDKVNGLSP